MRISVGLPCATLDAPQTFLDSGAISELARAVEAAGFDAVFVTDHPCPPESWVRSGGHHATDPLITLAFAAAATSRLRVQTNLYVPAYRPPLISAHAVATLDVLSAGRVTLGVGAGYLEPEFDILGADFDRRNDALDEALAVMIRAWSGDLFDGHRILPRPVQRPHPPIWVGGNSRRAIRRAVELADGWLPMPSPARSAGLLRTPGLETVMDLAARLVFAREYADQIGRSAPLEVGFTPSGLSMFAGARPEPAAVVDSLRELAAIGVGYATVTLPADSRADFLRAVDVFGAEVLPAVAQL